MTLITVATINVRNRQDYWFKRRHLLVGQLVDAAPDLISLQELHFPIGQGRWLRNQLNARLESRNKKTYHLIQKRRYPSILHNQGVGILTRLPVVYSDTLKLGYGGRLALRVNVQLPTRHTLDFVCTHLHAPSIDVEARQEQAMHLSSWLRNHKWVPLQIVAGDFNELPTGAAIQSFKQHFISAYETVHGHEPLATFPTALVLPRSRFNGRPDLGWAGCLDYIFVSSGCRQVLQASIFLDQPAGDDDLLYPSDHVGLLATVQV